MIMNMHWHRGMERPDRNVAQLSELIALPRCLTERKKSSGRQSICPELMTDGKPHVRCQLGELSDNTMRPQSKEKTVDTRAMPSKRRRPGLQDARRAQPPRTGITLIEVTFAIGVILIGMVGLTAILPLAGHRAQDALNFDTAAAMSDGVIKEVASRRLLQQPVLPKDQPIATLDGSVIQNTTTGVIVPFCFDPIFAAGPLLGTTPANSYTPDYFPYYKLGHNPLLDPSLTPPGTSALPNQPRMKRVGLNFSASAYYGNISGNSTKQRNWQLEVARTLAESPNDLDLLRPKDRSVPGVLTGVTATGTTFPFGKRLPTGTYSWMITVDPDAESRYGSLSVVIYQSRERMLDFPPVNSGTPPTEPHDNAVSERLTLVTERSGFMGGAGGSVTIVSSSATLSDLTSNDWIMLSRNMDPRYTTGQYDVHAWYRVVGTDGDATIITNPVDTQFIRPAPQPPLTIPVVALSNGNTLWARRVLLDGPDWDFTSNADLKPTPNPNNWYTYATIVKDVVAVNEKTISLADF